MPTYSRHTIQDLKNQFDWQSYVEDHYSVKYANGRNGLELRIPCPNCGEAKHKCYINPERKSFHCFKCDFVTGKFDLFDFVSKTEGVTRGQALLLLLKRYKPVAPTEEDFLRYTASEDHVADQSSAGWSDVCDRVFKKTKRHLTKASTYEEMPALYRDYLQSRGIQEKELLSLNLYFPTNVDESIPVKNPVTSKITGDLRGRVIIPVYGPNGLVVSYQARDVTGTANLKYLTAPGSDLASTLWPYSLPYDGKSVVLVEGIFDALSVRRVEGASAYATFSKHISKDQIALLKKWGVENVTLWYDKRDAMKEMQRAVEILKMQFKNVYVLDLSNWPSDKDTGDFLSDTKGTANIRETLSKSISVYTLEYEKWKTTF